MTKPSMSTGVAQRGPEAVRTARAGPSALAAPRDWAHGEGGWLCEPAQVVIVRSRLMRATRVFRTVTAVTATVAASAAMLLAAPAALADPATTVSYPAWASATRYAGLAFDTCTAPPLATMQAWAASPYRAVGVYVGGQNRTCAQPELTRGWVRAVVDARLAADPDLQGPQPPCGGKPTDSKIVPSQAAAEGTCGGRRRRAAGHGARHDQAAARSTTTWSTTPRRDTAVPNAVLTLPVRVDQGAAQARVRRRRLREPQPGRAGPGGRLQLGLLRPARRAVDRPLRPRSRP